MPALVIFGRRWQVGSDDLVFPSFIDLIFRTVWLATVLVTYWTDESSFDCPGGQVLKIYLYSNVTLLHFAFLTDILLFCWSRSGSIMNVEPRKRVPGLLYIRIMVQVLEVGLGIGGSVCACYGSFGCNEGDISAKLATGLIISNFVLAGVVVLIILLTFDPLGTTLESSNYGKLQNELPPFSKNTRIWELRCKVLGCACTRKDRNIQASFAECGKIVGGGLQDVDLVPSDITAALILLFKENREKAQLLETVVTGKMCSYSVISQPKSPVFQGPNAWNSPKLIHHFLKYGAAGYTMLAVYFSRKDPCQRLWRNALCCRCIPGRHHPVTMEGDNCCACHTSAIKDIIEDDLENIIHASYKNDYFKSPFFIAVDHKTRSIVLSIRPSLSFHDFITDLTCWPVPMDIPGLSPKFMCHHGVKLSATILKNKLESLKLLSNLTARYPDYSLVLTGDSLGAATSVVLGMMLRATYPSLKVYAYSPPGGLLSKEAAEYCNDFVLSVTYGDDMVARLSILACQELKHSMLEALNRSNTPKYKILLQGCWLAFGSPPTGLNEICTKEDQDNANTILRAEAKEPTKREGFLCVPLYPPGEILHITEVSDGATPKPADNTTARRWRYRWADRTEFGAFEISPRMLLDHLPFRMLKALDHLVISSSS